MASPKQFPDPSTDELDWPTGLDADGRPQYADEQPESDDEAEDDE